MSRPRLAHDLIEDAARRYGCTPREVTTRNMSPAFVSARRFVARELRAAGWTLPRISRILGYRDNHSTVIHLLKTQDRVKATPRFDPRAAPADESGLWA